MKKLDNNNFIELFLKEISSIRRIIKTRLRSEFEEKVARDFIIDKRKDSTATNKLTDISPAYSYIKGRFRIETEKLSRLSGSRGDTRRPEPPAAIVAGQLTG